MYLFLQLNRKNTLTGAANTQIKIMILIKLLNVAKNHNYIIHIYKNNGLSDKNLYVLQLSANNTGLSAIL